MKRGLRRLNLVFAGAFLLAVHGLAQAKPLSSKECEKFSFERDELAKKGLEKLMDHDPSNADGGLKPEQIAEIERFLYIEGELRFRCPQIKIAVPASAKPETAKEEPSKAEGTKTESDKADLPKEPQPSGPAVPFPLRKPTHPSKRAS